MYSLEQLKIFVMASEKGSLAETARALGRAQSGVSQAMANLEVDLNQTLFIRSKSGLTLTSAGKSLLPLARQLLRQADFFDQQLLALQRNEEAEISVAIDESLWSEGLLQAFTPLQQQFRQTRFHLITASTFDIEQMVAEGKVQLGVIYKDFDMAKFVEFDFHFLGNYRFITVASPQHPLAQLAEVSPQDLMNYVHLTHRSLNGQELWFAGSDSEHCWYANDRLTIYQWALQGIGWADLPEQMVQADLANGRLIRLPLAVEPEGNQVGVVCLRSRSHSHGAVSEWLLVMFKQFFAHIKG
ncbi:DNA-binding transcriptional LysR family regulator [Volucribacter psittacicida]|uniref:DNA-binding transcriptional LysR family regulator n=1 Tax=Volucribacter psittacicida TaxID=203482 RepID=A0A4R1FY61_9PAST|nr:LysR family transcriptional regulator [Volucribacter psittacicida]TCJ98772.1 DNA-binding transcriptional LysR family regulator [Volucribacter psittacicida]